MRAVAYPTVEAAGAIWAYLGPLDTKPPFPDFDFVNVPENYVLARKRYQQSNYLQILEGDQDGPLTRRESEHLGVTDRAILGARRLLLRLAEELESGVEPAQPQHAAACRLRSLHITAARDADPIELWRQAQAAGVAPSSDAALDG